MKKLILMAAIATLSLNLVACSGDSSNVSNDINTSTESSKSQDEEATSIKTFVGQISDKIGNDITVSLGNLVLDNNEGTNETVIYDGNGDPKPYDGDGSEPDGEMIMIPAPEDESSNDSTSTAPIEKLPIEFTGEVRSFTVPAGAKILNSLGKEVNFDAVKKGSLVQMVVNESTGAIESLMVW